MITTLVASAVLLGVQQDEVQKGPDRVFVSIEMYRTGGAQLSLPNKIKKKELGEGIQSITWGDIDETESLFKDLEAKGWLKLVGRSQPRLVNAPRVTTLDKSPFSVRAGGIGRTFGWDATPFLSSQGVRLMTKFREFKTEDEFTVEPYAMNFTLPYGKHRVMFVESDEAKTLWRFIARPISKS
jgi:hypothetical protein